LVRQAELARCRSGWSAWRSCVHPFALRSAKLLRCTGRSAGQECRHRDNHGPCGRNTPLCGGSAAAASSPESLGPGSDSVICRESCGTMENRRCDAARASPHRKLSTPGNSRLVWSTLLAVILRRHVVVACRAELTAVGAPLHPGAGVVAAGPGRAAASPVRPPSSTRRLGGLLNRQVNGPASRSTSTSRCRGVSWARSAQGLHSGQRGVGAVRSERHVGQYRRPCRGRRCGSALVPRTYKRCRRSNRGRQWCRGLPAAIHPHLAREVARLLLADGSLLHR